MRAMRVLSSCMSRDDIYFENNAEQMLDLLTWKKRRRRFAWTIWVFSSSAAAPSRVETEKRCNYSVYSHVR